MIWTYLAEYGEATVLHIEGWRICRTGIGPRGVAGRGERHVPHSDRIQGAQHGQRAAQRVSALDAGQRAELLVLMRLNDVCNEGESELVKTCQNLHNDCTRLPESSKLGRAQFVFGY